MRQTRTTDAILSHRCLEYECAWSDWETGSAFQRSALIRQFHTVEEERYIDTGRLEFSVQDDIKDEGDSKQMIWTAP